MENLGFLNLSASKGDRKKLEIVKCAIGCIANVGYEKITYQLIADELGTTRAHIAYHFKDRSSLIKASIQYIFSHYQSILSDNMDKAKKGSEDVLVKYIESPFMWAKDNPDELAVMIMFYYLCLVNEDYKKMHHDLRESGVIRIMHILTNDMQMDVNSRTLSELAKCIQNLMSGAILDSGTTLARSIDQAKEDTISSIMMLLKVRDSL